MMTNLLSSSVARLRFLLVILVMMFATAEMWGAEVLSETFTFNSTDGIQELGLEIPADGKGTNLDDKETYSKGLVSMIVSHGSTNTRIWNSSGSYDLRVYKSGGKLTFSVPSGYQITVIQHTGTTGNISTNVGSYNTGSWTGSAQSVTYTASGTLNLKKFVIVYEAINQSIDVTLHYKGTSTTISNQTSPYTLPTTGDYVADACDGWEFAGWYGSEYENSETEPSYITQLPSTGDAYAVYSHTETTQGGGSSEENVDFSSQGYTNQQEVSSYDGTNFSVAFDKGSNSNTPKYYTSGFAIRIYGGGYFTVSSDATITKIVLGFGSSDGSNAITTNVNTYSNGTWTGSAKSVKFTIGGSTGHRRIASLTVTTSGGGSTTYYHSTPDCGSTQPTVYLIPKCGGDGGGTWIVVIEWFATF